MMHDKGMMRVWRREWEEEVKKGIVDNEEFFDSRINYPQSLKDKADSKTE